MLHTINKSPFEKDSLKTCLRYAEKGSSVLFIEDAVYALFSGATLIEKHFTINNNLPGRDNKFALCQKDFAKLNSYRDKYKKFMISKGLDLQNCEKDIYKNYRGRWSKNLKN